MNLQFGAGLDGPEGWLNVDASPTLRLQRLPIAGPLLRPWLHPQFSRRVVYGDVVRGLRLSDGSVDLVYCSHVLEHLALSDCLLALREVLRVLKPGGVFRGVLPDLAQEVQAYLSSRDHEPATEFMRSTLMGWEERPRGLLAMVRTAYGNSRHLWMWDFPSLAYRLNEAGFIDIRAATFNDSSDPAFRAVESAERWENALGFECRKPR
ncbi:class I SAM-dependent methyltransferase [Luteimonas vadosa]|uniref:Methyltransferase type 11 domain-containing protein n=1 Tax=Luteimonas vadosa TaxID=1165507 RepID=A0ABP9DNM2_9GAMM